MSRSVRRQIICNIWVRDKREDLPPLELMLSGLSAMWQASGLDVVSFDPFSLPEEGLTTPGVDVGRRQVADALVVAKPHFF